MFIVSNVWDSGDITSGWSLNVEAILKAGGEIPDKTIVQFIPAIP
jgi:hypothetical protein